MGGRLRGAIAAALMVGLLGAAARADQLDEAIDRALIKDKAGRPAEALEALEPLASQFDADPRLHFYRFLFLRSLGRGPEAGDVLERAAAAAETFQPPAEGRVALEDLKTRIAAESRDVLRYRTPAREALKAYGKGGLTAARALLDAGRPALALYALDELGQAVDDRESVAAIAALRGEMTVEVRDAWAAGRLHRGDPAASGDLKRAEKNAADAARALQGKRFDEARIAALAALEGRPGDAGTLACLAEALDGLGRTDEAVEAAVRTLEARGDARSPAAPHQARALHLLRARQPAVADFAELRSSTAKSILALAARARTAKREPDAVWLEVLAALVAPADPAVQKALAGKPAPGTAPPPRPRGAAPAAAGFTDLLRDPSIWQWRQKGAGTALAHGEILLTDNRTVFMTEAIPQGVSLAPRFTLRFEMRLELDPQAQALAGEPAFWLVFAGSGAPDDVPNALLVIPRGRHEVGFARQVPDRWSIGETQTLPADVPKLGAWHRYELTWSQATRRLVLQLDGKPAFDYVLKDGDRLDGPFSFADGGVASIRLRSISLKNEP